MESIHPALVHFPIALLLASVFIEGLALLLKKEAWRVASLWTLLLGWAGAVAAVLTGRQAMAVASHSAEIHEVMSRHERAGYIVLAISTVVLVWHLASRGRLSVRSRWTAWLLLAAAGAGISYGAWLGGRMVYEYGVGGTFGRPSAGEAVPEHEHHHHHH